MSDSCSVYSGDDRKKVVVGGQERDRKKKERSPMVNRVRVGLQGLDDSTSLPISH
jgi:hypothetical protein